MTIKVSLINLKKKIFIDVFGRVLFDGLKKQPSSLKFINKDFLKKIGEANLLDWTKSFDLTHLYVIFFSCPMSYLLLPEMINQKSSKTLKMSKLLDLQQIYIETVVAAQKE